MIVLDQPTKKLEVVLSGAVATSQADVNSYYFDQIPSVQAQSRNGHNYVATNNTTDVTAVAAPVLVGIRRNIFSLSVYNKDTAAIIVTVKIDDGGSERILVKQSLNSGDSLQYEHGAGWTFTTPISIPFSDTLNIIKGSADPTKQLRIEVDGLTTNTTRVWTAPDVDLTVVGVDATQTLTNKTLTSPTINSGALGGSTTATTQAANDNSTKVATTAYTDRASGLILIQSQTASDVATVDFTTGISSTYDHYILDCTKVVPQTDNTAMWVRVSTDGGSTYLSTNEYSYTRISMDTVPASTAEGAGAQAQFIVKGGLGTGTGEHLNCQIHFQNLSDTAKYKGATTNGVIYDETASHVSFHGGCTFITTSAINAIRLMQGSGNINGTFTLYGVRKA